MKLPMGAAEGISNSKRLYVIERIKTLEDSQLISLDKKRPEELSKVWPGKTLPNDADWHDSTYLNSRYLEQCGMLECSRGLPNWCGNSSAHHLHRRYRCGHRFAIHEPLTLPDGNQPLRVV